MSEPQINPSTPEPQPRPAASIPTTPPVPSGPPAAPPTAAAARSSLLSVALTFSFLFNCGAVVVLAIVCLGVVTLRGRLDPDALANAPLPENVNSGNSNA